MTSKLELIELTEDDLGFKAIGDPKIIDFSNEGAKRRQITDTALYGAQAYRLGEKREVIGEMSRSWLQSVQYYVKA